MAGGATNRRVRTDEHTAHILCRPAVVTTQARTRAVHPDTTTAAGAIRLPNGCGCHQKHRRVEDANTCAPYNVDLGKQHSSARKQIPPSLPQWTQLDLAKSHVKPIPLQTQSIGLFTDCQANRKSFWSKTFLRSNKQKTGRSTTDQVHDHSAKIMYFAHRFSAR